VYHEPPDSESILALKNIDSEIIDAIVEQPASRLYPTDALQAFASFKSQPEDFMVEEIPLYPASGTGEHLLIQVEKRMMTTMQLVARIAELTGADLRDIGFAGRKDSVAVARQYLSLPKRCAGNLRDEEGFRILSQSAHDHKLRLGHSRGNRFRICLRDLRGAEADQILAKLRERAEQGFWNIFGSQRFSERGRGLAHAFSWIDAGCPRLPGPVSKPQFLASIWQSAIFNWSTILRVQNGMGMEPVEGDIAIFAEKRGAGGIDEKRVPSGPMWGPSMKRAGGPIGEYETAALSIFAGDERSMAKLSKWATGERRALVVRAGDFEGRSADGNRMLEVEFSLPAGSFATVFLGSVLRLQEPSAQITS
jgi:tRNA pseudouridine13 synthase